MPFKRDEMSDLTSLQEKMGKLFSESVRRIKEITDPDPDKPWLPPVDIFETSDSFVLLVETPGIPRENVAVEVVGQTLAVSGERPNARESEEGTLYRSERHYGHFERTFNLPVNVDADNIKARMVDGVLTITVRKSREETAGVKIVIE